MTKARCETLFFWAWTGPGSGWLLVYGRLDWLSSSTVVTQLKETGRCCRPSLVPCRRLTAPQETERERTRGRRNEIHVTCSMYCIQHPSHSRVLPEP